MIRQYLPKNVKELVHWYERYVSPLSLVAGFVSDNLILLRRVDLWTTDALFIFYLVVSSAGIILINLIETGRLRQKFWVDAAPIIPVVVQFAFGGLFSGFLSLYSRSADYAASWIFVILVAALLLGNERFLRFYVRVPVQLSILFTTLFSFFIFFLPVVFHAIGPWMFAASGACALALVALFIALLTRVVPETKGQLTVTARAIAVIYVLFNVLYFTNAIPPLPLSLKDAGVYHSVVRDASAGTYTLVGEEEPWYDAILPLPSVFHETPGGRVYVYTSVFAPSGLSTQILHEWRYYDASSGTWVTRATIEYPIQGGRDGGYEGYSQLLDPAPGKWRVDVVTQYGALIGRVSFTVVDVATSSPSTTIVK
ncbi:MAG TPA: DUF2914 domain-containing protein [Candidatus Paceibacterota bacterium]|nr:DUF2914 domain-containing protein [Candidatus Paceibacterota bacterium]